MMKSHAILSQEVFESSIWGSLWKGSAKQIWKSLYSLLFLLHLCKQQAKFIEITYFADKLVLI